MKYIEWRGRIAWQTYRFETIINEYVYDNNILDQSCISHDQVSMIYL